MTTHLDDRGAPRQDHYGMGRQAWDDILDLGWAPEFSAGNVLKYLRRDKNPEHSIESAKRYHAWLVEMSRGDLLNERAKVKESNRQRFVGRAAGVLAQLNDTLLITERELLR